MSATVTVVLPTRNDRADLTDCLDSLALQDHDGAVEIVVVDRGSSDGSRELANARRGVRVVDNRSRWIDAAVGAGVAVADGDIVFVADARERYEPDFVRRGIAALDAGASTVGADRRPVGSTSFGRAVAAVVDTGFGTATTVTQARVWRVSRGAVSPRVTDHAIGAWSLVPSTVMDLARAGADRGRDDASARRISTRSAMGAALVATTTAAVVTGRRRWFTVPVAHAIAAAVVAVRVGGEPGVAPHRAWLAIAVDHWSYAGGLVAGCVGRARQAG